tara:strand:+ start:74 stop:688 length:615 start_codon:yes stop_codon:yes gene_type:complete
MTSSSLKDGAYIPTLSVGWDDRSRMSNAASMNNIGNMIIANIHTVPGEQKKHSHDIVMENLIDSQLKNSDKLVKKLSTGNYKYFDTLSDYKNEIFIDTNEKNMFIKPDLLNNTLPTVDLDSKNYVKNNDLNNETLGDFEVPLIAPIKNLEGNPYNKFKSTVDGYKDMDRGFLLNTHREIVTSNGSVGHSFKIHPRNSKTARVYG